MSVTLIQWCLICVFDLLNLLIKMCQVIWALGILDIKHVCKCKKNIIKWTLSIIYHTIYTYVRERFSNTVAVNISANFPGCLCYVKKSTIKSNVHLKLEAWEKKHLLEGRTAFSAIHGWFHFFIYVIKRGIIMGLWQFLTLTYFSPKFFLMNIRETTVYGVYILK